MKRSALILICFMSLLCQMTASISNACIEWTGKPGEYTIDESGHCEK